MIFRVTAALTHEHGRPGPVESSIFVWADSLAQATEKVQPHLDEWYARNEKHGWHPAIVTSVTYVTDKDYVTA